LGRGGAVRSRYPENPREPAASCIKISKWVIARGLLRRDLRLASGGLSVQPVVKVEIGQRIEVAVIGQENRVHRSILKSRSEVMR
jgi:hypothetical protein